jgi:hypothetical protein
MLRRRRLHRKLLVGTNVRVPMGSDPDLVRRDIHAFARTLGKRAIVTEIGGTHFYVRMRDLPVDE